MHSTLEQQDIDVFSTDPTGVKERPDGTHYTDGVDIGYTAPAKWWNWFWNHITTWFGASKTDKTAMLSEELNVLSEASILPNSAYPRQMSTSVNTIASEVCDEYDSKEITEEIDGVMVTHKVNQPYVIGHTLYIPDTELL